VISYNDDLAADFGRAVRNLLAEHGPDLFGVELTKDSKSASRFTTMQGGGLVAAGVGGTITGKGANLLVMDDVVKNHVEALSETVQRRHWDFWQSTVRTRLAPAGAVVGIGTRWTEADLLGRLIGSGRFDVVNLPALAEDDDPLDRAPGEALWPDQFPVEYLSETKEDVGPFWWAAQYQGSPQPLDGNLFKRSSFRYYTHTEAVYQLEDRHVPKDECTRFVTVDTALARTETADWTVAAVWAQTKDGDLILLERYRQRISPLDQPRLLRRIHEEWRPRYIAVEQGTAGIAAIDGLQRDGIRVKKLVAKGDKHTRALDAADYIDRGKVWFPHNRTWLDEWESELVVFPQGRHDDQVDALSYAVGEAASRRNPYDTPEAWRNIAAANEALASGGESFSYRG
jgi:predicted phage terminase large subunit-like protein